MSQSTLGCGVAQRARPAEAVPRFRRHVYEGIRTKVDVV